MVGRAALGAPFDTDMGVEPAGFVPEFMVRGGGIVIFRPEFAGSVVSGSSWRRMICTYGMPGSVDSRRELLAVAPDRPAARIRETRG